MFSYRYLIFLGGILLLFSCGYSSKNNPEYLHVIDSQTIEVEEDGRGGYDDNSDIGNIRLTGRIETGNKFMG